MIEQILVECIQCIPKRVNAFEIGVIMLPICCKVRVERTELPTADICSVEKLNWQVSWSLQYLYYAIYNIQFL
jgi:hypothetical protein